MRTPASPRLRRGLAVLLVALFVVAGFQAFHTTRETTVTAHFRSAEGLYRGDDVKVLGVRVGEVASIDPEGDGVRVRITVEDGVKVPVEAHAAIVSPSLVSGRFVQLSPAWTSGPTLDEDASIPVERTAVPVSFDEVKTQLTDLSTALAPQGKAKQPLADAVRTLDKNLRAGNSAELKTAIEGLRNAAGTLSDGRSDLFTTIEHLNGFTQNLAVNDAAVGGFTRELDSVSTVLATNRRELTRALAALASALGSSGDFLSDNRARIRTSIRDINLLSAALADRSDELAGVLHIAPTALIDLYNIIDDQAITGRASLAGLSDAAQLICGAVLGAGGTAKQCRDALAPLVNLLKLGQKNGSKGKDPVTSVLPDAPTTGGLTELLGGLGEVLPGVLGKQQGGAR